MILLIYLLVGFCLGSLSMYWYYRTSFKSSGFLRIRNVTNVNNKYQDEQDYKMVLVIRSDLQMTKGKVAAQCCHAALENYINATQGNANQVQWLSNWKENGQAKITLKVDSQEEMLTLKRNAIKDGLIANYIRDAGRTQVAAGSMTVLAIGPAPVDLIDSITGYLKLY